MSGKANLQGRVIGGLIVSESAGNHRWNIQCDKCGARGTESHAALVSGMARCKASGCRDNAEAVRAAQSEPLPKARRKAITDEANERQSAEDRAEAERAAIEAQWADGHDQLAKLIRERIATQRDDECWIEPATLALSMRQADADNFNRTEAAKYAESNPSFFPSRANREALGGYFDRNGIAIVSSATRAAAVRRHRVVVENRAERRNGRARLIAMEILARDHGARFIVVELAHERICGRFADRRFAGVLTERAEISREADLVFKRDVLIAKENNLILRERRAQLLSLRGGERLREIDVADLSADVGRCGRDGDRVVADGAKDRRRLGPRLRPGVEG